MSDLNALAQKLAALTAKNDMFGDGGRIISQGGVPSPLTAVLKAIDETLLERKLDFIAGNTTISVVASERRLRGVIAVEPAANRPANLIGQALSRDEPAFIDAAFELFNRVAGKATKLTLRSSMPSEPFGQSGERGISANGLAELWHIEIDEVPLPPMERFLHKNKSAISAFLHVSAGKIVGNEGDFTALQSIWETQVTDFIKAQKRLPTRAKGPQLVYLEGALEDGAAAALALADDEIALLVYDDAQLGTLHASWQAIFR